MLAGESYLDCHIHVDTLVSRTSQSEVVRLKVVITMTNGPVYLSRWEKNQCPREGMFSGSFAKARGRDEG